jgi:hypothetical protein
MAIMAGRHDLIGATYLQLIDTLEEAGAGAIPFLATMWQDYAALLDEAGDAEGATQARRQVSALSARRDA